MMRYSGLTVLGLFRTAVALTVLTLLMPVLAQAKVSCVASAQHKSITYFLVDRSDSLKNPAPLERVIDLVANDALKNGAGTRFVIGVITGRSANTRILVDRVNPENSIWESQMKLRKKRRDLRKCIESSKKQLLAAGESHPHSAILETLGVVSDLVQQDTSANKRLVIYSDMIQNSEALSFYRKVSKSPDSLMASVKKDGLLPDMTGVKVYVAGTGGSKSDRKDRLVKAFWREYFKEAGADLRFYGPLMTSF